MPLGEHVINDYQSLSYSLKAHPMSFLRQRLVDDRYLKNETLQTTLSDRMVKVAGLVLVRQRPGSAKGVIFATIEDETGVANLIVWPKAFEKYRTVILGSRCIGVRGRLQKEDGVIHVVVHHLEDLTPLLADIANLTHPMGGLANADEVRRPQETIQSKIKPASRLDGFKRKAPTSGTSHEKIASTKATRRALPKGRNFH
jgi:error-prone DNA polymerase